MGIRLKELAAQIGVDLGSVSPSSEDIVIEGINSLTRASSTDVSFVSSRAHLDDLQVTRAAAVVIQPELADQSPVPILLHDHPYIAYAQITALFASEKPSAGIHETAVISQNAEIGREVSVGANVYVADGARILDGAVLGANVSVGKNAFVGRETLIHPNVQIYPEVQIGDNCILHSGTVVGSDGFGFAPTPEGWLKIHQLGRVIVGNYVEIGANCAIDRGAIEDTVIADGVKIDNLVHIAHNVQIGENTAIAGQVGIAGSTKIGKNCMFGGQVGITGHIEIADGVTVTGQGMVTKSVTKAGVYSSGISLSESSLWRKNVARFHKLDALFRRLIKLEKELELKNNE